MNTTETTDNSIQTASLREAVFNFLEDSLHTSFEEATPQQLYRAFSSIVNARLAEMRAAGRPQRREVAKETDGVKKIHYICMEFLMGQSLKNHLYNLGMTEDVAAIIADKDLTPADLYDCEPDAGLGNGGLGRLAACFIDALATGGYDAVGYSLCYQYGLFKQKLVDGWQVEMPDNWLPGGRVWLNAKEDDSFRVNFYGDYKEEWKEEGLTYVLSDAQTVEAIPYDMYVSGADTDHVCKLRLWRARDFDGFDMESFNSGDFTRAAQKSNSAELITKVLYPADNIEEGKELRLKQQYFMVSASCQNIVRNHYHRFGTLDNFSDKQVIHINDTHPALCVPELMRIFMDDYGYDWDSAWYQVTRAVSYTNHTILAEALEKWNSDLVRTMMPRIYIIIEEIDNRFRDSMNFIFPGDTGKIDYMAVLGNKQVRMANLSVIGSHKVNGVSALHSQILKDDLFHDYYLATPEKFTNVTNGIAYRRWLCQSNPELSALLDECIGPDYRLDYRALEGFSVFADDSAVLERLETIKHNNKVRMAEKIEKESGVRVDPNSVFIVQAKRMHEYKRQLLNVLRIIARYAQLKDDPGLDIRPETYLFAAKAAPSYFLVKDVIQLIAKLGEEIEQDPVISSKLKVLFLENYSVSMAETLMPATEVSEQISLAGKEASGTGNMKMMINGAVTIGTMDGANVEMHEALGDDNIYIFGQRAPDVASNLMAGYDAAAIYEQHPMLKQVIDRLATGFAGKDFKGLKDYLLKPSYSIADPYMCLYDFDDYCRVHEQIRLDYEDRAKWNRMSVINIAKAARFAADRSIADYTRDIWETKPVVQ